MSNDTIFMKMDGKKTGEASYRVAGRHLSDGFPIVELRLSWWELEFSTRFSLEQSRELREKLRRAEQNLIAAQELQGDEEGGEA